MKIALVHDSLTQLGGAEKVVDVLHEMFPEAPLYVLVLDKKLHDTYKGWDIRTSWLQKIYNFYPKFQHLLPFIPAAVGSLDFSRYDVVLSSSSGFAKGVKVSPGIHVNYCHTPTRFLWSDFDYIRQEVPAPLRPFANVFLQWMKRWDLKAAQRVNYFIANSKEVQKRITVFYGRDSEVVHPPVDTEFWHPTKPKSDYFLLAGRLQAHKKNEFIIEIFNELGLPLRVAGTGRQEKYLRSIAKDNVTFLGRISDEALRDEYSGAVGFVYPQLEDAGLMPLEAASCGTASIGLAKGGSLETIVPGKTGELFVDYDREAVKKVILNWDPRAYDMKNLQSHAQNFSKEVFIKKINAVLEKL